MANITYNEENAIITIVGIEEVEKALGELRDKAPAATKVAINATAREARRLMIAQAKARYAVNAAGARHLKDLVQRKKATNRSLNAELHIASLRNDLGYFQYSPKGVHTGREVFASAAEFVKGKVLKKSGMEALTGTAQLSKGFVLEFKSGHVGMVQRVIGSSSKHKKTAKGYQRWRAKDGRVEKLQTMGSPSATAMHHTIWPMVEPQVEAYLQTRLDAQVERVIDRAIAKERAKEKASV
jgi:hypothetical protein